MRLSFSRGQATVEWLVWVAVGLGVLLVLAGFWFNQQQSFSSQSDVELAQSGLDGLTQTAAGVFGQGAGASATVEVLIPSNTDFSRSGVSGQSVFLQVGPSSVVSKAAVPLLGGFESGRTGAVKIPLQARATYVHVGESLLSLSDYRLSFSAVPGSSQSRVITLANASIRPVTVTVLGESSSDSFSFSATPATLSIPVGGFVPVTVTVSATGLATGVADANVWLFSSNGVMDENVLVPVLVSFESAVSASTFRFIPSSLSLSGDAGSVLDGSVRLCNGLPDSVLGLSLTPSSVVNVRLPKMSGAAWAVSGDTDHVYAASQDGGVYVWLSDHTFLKRVSVSQSALLSLASDGGHLVAGGSDGTVYDLATNNFSVSWTGRQNGAAIRAVSVDSSYVYGAASDGLLHVWQKSSGAYVTHVSNSASALNAVVADGPLLYLGSDDGNVYVYEVNTWRYVRALLADSAVMSLSVISGKLLAGTQNGKVVSFNPTGGPVLGSLYLSVFPVRFLAADNSGAYVVAAASEDGVYFLDSNLQTGLHASAGTNMISAATVGSLAVLGTALDAVYVVDYAGFDQQAAGLWLSDLPDVSSVSSGSCVPLDIRVSVPPQTPEKTVYGRVTAEADDTEPAALVIRVAVSS